VDLLEGERVYLTVVTFGDITKDPAYNLAEIAEETGIPAPAINIDYYLYGLPKQSDEQMVRKPAHLYLPGEMPTL